jgi:hypothetical protein
MLRSLLDGVIFEGQEMTVNQIRRRHDTKKDRASVHSPYREAIAVLESGCLRRTSQTMESGNRR